MNELGQMTVEEWALHWAEPVEEIKPEPEKKKSFWEGLGDAFLSGINFLGKTIGDIIGAGTDIIKGVASTAAKAPETVMRTVLGVLAGRSLKKVYAGMGYEGFVDDKTKNAQMEAAYKNMELMLEEMKKQNAEAIKEAYDYIDQRLNQMVQQGLISPTDPAYLAIKEELAKEKAELKPAWFWPVVIGIPAAAAAIIALMWARK